MRLSLKNTISRLVLRFASLKTYLKDNLKIYFDFDSIRAKTLEFVGEGSISHDASAGAQNISIPSATFKFGETQDFTIMFWFKTTTTGRTFFDNSDGSSIGYKIYGSTRIVCAMKGDGGTANDGDSGGSTTWNDGEWHHWAGVFNRASSRYFYLDGVLDRSLGISSVGDIDNLMPIHFMNNNQVTVGNNGLLNGGMKNVGIWKRALTLPEVQNIMYKTYDNLKGTELTHLQGWWALETNANGSVGTYGINRIDGTATGGASQTFSASIYGNNTPKKPRGFDNSLAAQADLIGSGSALFDGDDDFVELGSQAGDLRLSGSDGTVSAWILLPDVSDGDTYKRIVDKSDAGSGENGYTMWVHTDGIAEFQINAVAGSKVTSPTAITDGVWTHMAATWDGTTVKLYQNGILVDSATDSAQPPSDTTGMRIGSWNHAGAREFQGNIAQVGIWSAALTQEQIQSISQKSYSELSTSEKTNLVSWWGLDVNADDEHGSNDGTLV